MLVMLLRVIGGTLIALGIMWVLQGLGLLQWPAGSFMLARRKWALYGVATAAVGALLLGLFQWRVRR